MRETLTDIVRRYVRASLPEDMRSDDAVDARINGWSNIELLTAIDDAILELDT